MFPFSLSVKLKFITMETLNLLWFQWSWLVASKVEKQIPSLDCSSALGSATCVQTTKLLQ